MSKKILYLLVIMGMVFAALTGCGGGAAQSSASQPGASSQAAAPAAGAKPANFPTKPLELVVPYTAGGAVDIVARAIASVLPDYLDGARIVVTNVEGGNGVVGVSQTKSKPADGSSFSIYASPVFEIAPFMNDIDYTMNDFTFLGTVVQRPNVMVVHADSPYTTLEDFVQHAKRTPGVTYGDPAAGSAHLGFEAFLKIAGIATMKFIPYSGGSGEAMTALLGKHVEAVIALPADTYEHIRAGTLRALCVQGDRRIDSMPDIPTSKEAGYDVVVGLTNGFIAPAGLAPEIAAYLSAALEKAVKDPRVLELDPGDEGLLIYHGGEATKKLLSETATSFESLIQELGLAR